MLLAAVEGRTGSPPSILTRLLLLLARGLLLSLLLLLSPVLVLVRRCARGGASAPLSIEYPTCKTVKARFWHLLGS